MNNGCICHSDPCSCELLERPRYFPRQLISDTEMTLDQSYFRSRLRLHNRMLHGWGVVCGALVCRAPAPTDDNSNGHCDNGATDCDGYKPWKIIVKRGYILGPYGDDIVIGCDHEVDLRTIGVTGISGESTEDAEDPWCCATTTRQGDGCYWVAVKYKECKARPVRVQPVGCGCDDTRCEYSRWRDGYEIGIRDSCPDVALPKFPPFPEFNGSDENCIPPCPPCPEDPWVVLAKVCVDENGCIESIDNCDCRRLVASFAHYWWACSCTVPKVIAVVVDDSEANCLEPGTENVAVTISGENLARISRVKFCTGVELQEPISIESATEIKVTVSVASNATAGDCTVRVIDPCGAIAVGTVNICEPLSADAETAKRGLDDLIGNKTRTTRKTTTRKKATRKKATRKKTTRRTTSKKTTSKKTGKKKVTRKRGTSRRPRRRKR